MNLRKLIDLKMLCEWKKLDKCRRPLLLLQTNGTQLRHTRILLTSYILAKLAFFSFPETHQTCLGLRSLHIIHVPPSLKVSAPRPIWLLLPDLPKPPHNVLSSLQQVLLSEIILLICLLIVLLSKPELHARKDFVLFTNTSPAPGTGLEMY